MTGVVCVAAVSCLKLDSGLRNRCARSEDCNAGRVCLAGICQQPSDAASEDTSPDVPADVGINVDAVADDDVGAAVDSSTNADAGAAAPLVAHPDAAADADAVADADTAADADAAAFVADAGQDATMLPDPCVPGSGDGSPVSRDELPLDLIGSWRLCDVGGMHPDVTWLMGGVTAIQIGPTSWWRLPDGHPVDDDRVPQGSYFRLLEGSSQVFHFLDLNFAGGDGADISLRLYSRSRALEMVGCDGVARCGELPTRLVPLNLAPGG